MNLLIERESLNSRPCEAVPRAIRSSHKEPGAGPHAPLTGQLPSRGALGSRSKQRRREQTDFILLDCFIKQSQAKQNQPRRQYTGSSFTQDPFPQLWENKKAEV